MYFQKSVLISTQPKFCHKIIDGEKRIELRKTKPNLDTPFKACICCSAGSYKWQKDIWSTAYFPPSGECTNMSQMVIGEFVCDDIKTYYANDFVGAVDLDGTEITEPKDGVFAYWIPKEEEKEICLPYEEIKAYGNGKTLYGWHISDLKIYGKPRELSEFRKAGFMTEEDWLFNLYPNTHCHYEAWAKKFEITRPPQSWCYVEDLFQGNTKE